MRVNVQFRNVTNEPLILGYRAKSAKMADDLGNVYDWGRAGTYDRSVTGMGTVEARSAGADFLLQPGQQRTAAFELIRYATARKQLGASFPWNFAVQQLEILPSRQVQPGRQYSLNFQALDVRPPTAAGSPAQRQTTPAESIQQVRDLFKKKK